MMISFAIKAIIPVLAFFSPLILVGAGQKARWLFLSDLREPIEIPIYLIQLPIFGDLFNNISRLNYLKAIVLFFHRFLVRVRRFFYDLVRDPHEDLRYIVFRKIRCTVISA